MAVANQYATGISYYYSLLLNMTGTPVSVWGRSQTGNLSGTGDPIISFSGPLTLTVRMLKPRSVDEIMDPEHQAGYTLDEYWTMLYPTSATIRYRDVVTLSGSEGVANFIVTEPVAIPWGTGTAFKKATIRRVVNLSGAGYDTGQGASGWPA